MARTETDVRAGPPHCRPPRPGGPRTGADLGAVGPHPGRLVPGCVPPGACAAGGGVGRKLEWTQRMTESERLPDTIRARVPRPLGEFRVERNIIGYLE